MLGDLTEPGVYPARLSAKRSTGMDELFKGAASRLKLERGKSGSDNQLREEAVTQVGEGWFDGPCLFKWVNGWRFGVQQPEKLRAEGDLKRSLTNEATDLRAPVNLPSRGHLA